MKKITFLLLFGLVVLPGVVAAQSIITPQWEDFRVFSNSNTTGEVQQDAATGEITLTNGTGYSSHVWNSLQIVNPICAKDFIVEFDLYVGNKVGGAGVNVFGSYSPDGTPVNDPVFGSEVDTYKDPGWPSFEFNNNHVDIATKLGTLSSPNPSYLKYAVVGTPGWTLTNGTWNRYELRYTYGQMSVSLTSATGTSLRINAAASYEANRPMYLTITGTERPVSTGGVNLQKIKNLRVIVVEECDSQLDQAMVLQAIDPAGLLERCPIEDIALNDCMAKLDDFHAQGKINNNDYEMILSTIQTKASFCAGLNMCQEIPNEPDAELLKQSYDRGFSDGTASIDTDYYYKAGLEAGKGQVDTQGFYDQGYGFGFKDGHATGFDEGVASIDLEAIRAAAIASVDTKSHYENGYAVGYSDGAASVNTGQYWQEGFDQGVASIDQEALKAASYAAGVASVQCPGSQQPSSPLDLSGAAEILEVYCPCAEARNHGGHVSCVTKSTQDLVNLGVLTKTQRSILVRDAAKSSCGKPSTSALKKSKAGKAGK